MDTSPPRESRPSAGVAVSYPSLWRAAVTRPQPAGDAKAPCTSTTGGFPSFFLGDIERADGEGAAIPIRPTATAAARRSRERKILRPGVLGADMVTESPPDR